MLQWGRVLMNAETLLGHYVRMVGGYASMGPRSHERGNAGLRPTFGRVSTTLQWGRVLMNAETSRASCVVFHEALPRELQWGRVLMNAETRSLMSTVRDVRERQLQWGRVLMNAETPPSSSEPSVSQRCPCFNGAAFS